MGSAPVECMSQMIFKCVDHSNSTEPKKLGRNANFSHPVNTQEGAREIGVPSPRFLVHAIETRACDSGLLNLVSIMRVLIALGIAIPLMAQDVVIPQDVASRQSSTAAANADQPATT